MKTVGGNKDKATKPKPHKNTSVSARAEKIGRRPLEFYHYDLPHLVRDCKGRVIRTPQQEGEGEFKTDRGELSNLKALAASVPRPSC